jgi:hypothetical protein
MFCWIISLVSGIIVSSVGSGLFRRRNDGFVSRRRDELVNNMLLVCLTPSSDFIVTEGDKKVTRLHETKAVYQDISHVITMHDKSSPLRRDTKPSLRRRNRPEPTELTIIPDTKEII